MLRSCISGKLTHAKNNFYIEKGVTEIKYQMADFATYVVVHTLGLVIIFHTIQLSLSTYIMGADFSVLLGDLGLRLGEVSSRCFSSLLGTGVDVRDKCVKSCVNDEVLDSGIGMGALKDRSRLSESSDDCDMLLHDLLYRGEYAEKFPISGSSSSSSSESSSWLYLSDRPVWEK